MAVLGPRLQDHERPVRGLAHLHPDLLRARMKKGDSDDEHHQRASNERVGRMMMMHSNNREEIEEAFAGDIIALAWSQGHHDR